MSYEIKANIMEVIKGMFKNRAHILGNEGEKGFKVKLKIASAGRNGSENDRNASGGE